MDNKSKEYLRSAIEQFRKKTKPVPMPTKKIKPFEPNTVPMPQIDFDFKAYEPRPTPPIEKRVDEEGKLVRGRKAQSSAEKPN